MNKYKINTDIISTTGITTDSRNISKSTGKVVVNNVEVTDIDSWNKAISTFSELENKINNLQSKINKAIEILNDGLKQLDERNRCEVYSEEYLENARDILKED